MKKSLKIVVILLFLLITIFSIDIQALSWDEIIHDAHEFENAGQSKPLIDNDKIIDAVVPIGQMLTALGVAVLFGALILLGIKYMKAQPEERGKLKQQLIGLVISGIVIFGAFTIWRIAYNFFEEIF